MSRIHEALKKAEQERVLSHSPSGLETTPELRELPPEPVITNAPPPAETVRPVSLDAALARSRRTQWNPDPKTMLFFGDEEHASGMEEFRTLRARLYQIREKQPFSKLLVSSPLPKEGKSFTAANLAQVMVRQHGRRALLIDADLRNPQLHLVLGAERGPGLSEYLQGEVDEFSILQRGSMENLFLIPGGRSNQNPAELVANGRMRFLLSRLEPIFDWIILDSPPAALVSDAAQLANYADGVLLVVRSNGTPVDAARRARQEFGGHNVVGVVLNGISPELSPYSQYYYSAYGQNDKTEAKN